MLLFDTVAVGVVGDAAAFCLLSSALLVGVSSVSTFSQLLIGVDQYLAVTEPLHYHKRINKTRCTALCLLSWVIGGLLSTLAAFVEYTGVGALPNSFKTCSAGGNGSPAGPGSTASAAVYFSVSFAAPFLSLLFVYGTIFCAAHNNSVKTRRNSVCSSSFDCIANNNNNYCQQQVPYYGYRSNRLGVTRTAAEKPPATKTGGAGGESKPRRESRLLSNASNLNHIRMSVKRKLSNASGALFVYRDETRAAKVTAFIVLMILGCWGPHFVLSLAKVRSWTVHPYVDSLTLLLVTASPVLSPILYAYRSRRVQRDVRRVLGLQPNGGAGQAAILGSWDKAGNERLLRRARGAAKIQRMKSFSCPQLLISSAAENASSASSVSGASSSSSTQTTVESIAVPKTAVLPRKKLFPNAPIATAVTSSSAHSTPLAARRKFGLVQAPPLIMPSSIVGVSEVCPMLADYAAYEDGPQTPDVPL